MMTNKMEACNVDNVASFHFSSINPKQLTDIRQSEINREDNNINHHHLNDVKLDAVNACPRKSRHKRYACIHKLYRLYDYET